MDLTLADILAATGGRRVQGCERAALAGVSTDSRSVAAGDLSIANAGDRFDGPDSGAAAGRAGAEAALVRRVPAGCPAGLPVVVVGDTTVAYGRIAAWWRRRMPARVVGVTGSNGKTTTKDLLGRLLSRLGPTVASIANHNNHIGVPETLLRLRPEHRFAIVEMGSNHPGEIATLAELARPDVGVITNVGKSHLEFFGSLRGVQREKASLLDHLAPGGLAVLHADPRDRHSRAIRDDFKGPTITFGSAADATWRADAVWPGDRSVEFVLSHTGHRFVVPVVGAWQVDNCLAAVAVAHQLGLGLPAAVAALATCEPPSLRMNVRRRGQLTLIVDCYNANPDSMRAALGELAHRRTRGRRVAVLGDMLELGRAADPEHQALGKLVAGGPADLLCAVGEQAARVARAAVRAGMPRDRVLWSRDAALAAPTLCEQLLPNDTVLVKGSRGLRLERVAEAIEAWATAAPVAAAAAFAGPSLGAAGQPAAAAGE